MVVRCIMLVLTLPFYCLAAAPLADTAEASCDTKKEAPVDQSVDTDHSINILGTALPYKAEAGQMIIKDDKDCPKAVVFYVAYTKKDGDPRKRPVTFCFNGGPGSSSVWLHLGAFGPKRVLTNDKGIPQRPYQLVDNSYSILDKTDLVFIDPVSTGYSRPLPGQDAKQFHGVMEDIQSVGEFIRLYTTKNNRWESPKFLAGESYGTTRAAALSSYLHEKIFMSLDGIILVSAVLDFQTLSDSPYNGNDLPFVLCLPSFAATAWYYKKMPENTDLAATLKEVEDFAITEYALALLQGDELEPEKRKQVIAKLSSYTGLSADYLEKANMRVDVPAFDKELLGKENKVIGRFDAKFEGLPIDPCEKNTQYDPSFDSIVGGYTACLNSYLYNELQWKKGEEYRIVADVFPWNFGPAENQYLNVAVNLRDVMIKNPTMKVFVASGFYDLATPYFAAEYTLSHMYLAPSLKGNVTKEYYDGGHMMYVYEPVLKKLKEDLDDFFQKALSSPTSSQ